MTAAPSLQRSERTTTTLPMLALLIAGLSIAISTTVLYLAVWEHGTRLVPVDAMRYLRTGVGIFEGLGLGIHTYNPDTNSLGFQVTTHYPPLWSLVYAGGLSLGLAPQNIPSLMSLLGWVALLAGMGVLTYQLSRSSLLAALVVALAALTPGFWLVFLAVRSETIFLPLLVWLMVWLVDLPARESGQVSRLLGAAAILALLMLTRYSGLFVLAGVGLWWVWWQLYHRQFGRFIWGGLILGLSVLPLAAWLAYTRLYTERPADTHFGGGGYTFVDGVVSVAEQSVQLVMPTAALYEGLLRSGWPVLLVYVLAYLLVLLAAAFLLWKHRPERIRWFAPPRTPILLFVLVYFLIYTVAQPFMSFWPMDTRDMTSVLCLMLPWGAGLLAMIPTAQAAALLAGVVILNGVMAFAPAVLHGLPQGIEASPPRIRDVSGLDLLAEPFYTNYDRENGLPGVLVVEKLRMGTLRNHYPEVYARVQALESDTLIFTNVPPIYDPYPSVIAPPLSRWLEGHGCMLPVHSMLVVLDPGTNVEDATAVQQAVEQRCPGVVGEEAGRSIVYSLP